VEGFVLALGQLRQALSHRMFHSGVRLIRRRVGRN
jgi:hypothetical protein